jgi:tripartite-type tricarboxylate transporter receptor subunit TctC
VALIMALMSASRSDPHRTMVNPITVFAAALLWAVGAMTPLAAQEAWPQRTITMVVPFAAGGTSDVIARLVGEELGKALGVTIVHENVPGAGGSTALARVARAAADGYTIVLGNSGTNAASYAIYPEIKYKPEDFVAVGLVARTLPVIALKKEHAGLTLAEFIAKSKAEPKKYTLGHAGVGSSNYLICRTFLQAAGVEATLVGYRGAGPALNDLIGGQIDGVCDTATALAGSLKAGSIKGLVISAASRLASLPEVPTATEAGLPTFDAQGWNAVFVPKDVPAPIVARMRAALQTALASAFLRQRFGELETLLPSAEDRTPEVVAKLVAGDVERYRVLLKPN